MITLSSDFDWPYPAAMKGVIASRCDARLIDVTHQFPRGELRTTAFWLGEILPYFPPSVHLVVVDPGVGTDRDILVVRAGDHLLVGPDNGVLAHPASCLGGPRKAFALQEIESDSETFHGRDVFAPLAAELHGMDPADVGSLDSLIEREEIDAIRFPDPEVDDDTAKGTVLVIDGFGNVITNLPGSVLADRMGRSVRVNDESVPVRPSYGHVPVGARLATVGSHGNVELAVNQGRGSTAFDLESGDSVTVNRES